MCNTSFLIYLILNHYRSRNILLVLLKKGFLFVYVTMVHSALLHVVNYVSDPEGSESEVMGTIFP